MPVRNFEELKIAVAGTGYVGLSIAILDGASAYRDADFVVIAAPTNYDPCLDDVKDKVYTRDLFRRD